jgi:hypothetical protein
VNQIGKILALHHTKILHVSKASVPVELG